VQVSSGALVLGCETSFVRQVIATGHPPHQALPSLVFDVKNLSGRQHAPLSGERLMAWWRFFGTATKHERRKQNQ
jgi:hypothetical protein